MFHDGARIASPQESSTVAVQEHVFLAARLWIHSCGVKCERQIVELVRLLGWLSRRMSRDGRDDVATRLTAYDKRAGSFGICDQGCNAESLQGSCRVGRSILSVIRDAPCPHFCVSPWPLVQYYVSLGPSTTRLCLQTLLSRRVDDPCALAHPIASAEWQRPSWSGMFARIGGGSIRVV